MEPVIIGIDVGATSISGGLLTPQGEVLTAVESPTRRQGNALDTLMAVVDELVERTRNRRLRLRVNRMPTSSATITAVIQVVPPPTAPSVRLAPAGRTQSSPRRTTGRSAQLSAGSPPSS